MTRSVVLDTNIVLDLLVFDDPAARPLKAALDGGAVRWLATPPMREELERVLAYPRLVPRLAACGLSTGEVLARFDRGIHAVAPAPRAQAICKDPDDQPFIDLAVAHGALLLSKDNDVLRLKKRLATLGVAVQCAIKDVA